MYVCVCHEWWERGGKHQLTRVGAAALVAGRRLLIPGLFVLRIKTYVSEFVTSIKVLSMFEACLLTKETIIQRQSKICVVRYMWRCLYRASWFCFHDNDRPAVASLRPTTYNRRPRGVARKDLPCCLFFCSDSLGTIFIDCLGYNGIIRQLFLSQITIVRNISSP